MCGAMADVSKKKQAMYTAEIGMGGFIPGKGSSDGPLLVDTTVVSPGGSLLMGYSFMFLHVCLWCLAIAFSFVSMGNIESVVLVDSATGQNTTVTDMTKATTQFNAVYVLLAFLATALHAFLVTNDNGMLTQIASSLLLVFVNATSAVAGANWGYSASTEDEDARLWAGLSLGFVLLSVCTVLVLYVNFAVRGIKRPY